MSPPAGTPSDTRRAYGRHRSLRRGNAPRDGGADRGAASDLPPPFDALDPSPANAFDTCFYGAIVRLHEVAPPRVDVPELAFLRSYVEQLPAWACDGSGLSYARWWAAFVAWERSAGMHLPIGALCRALALDRFALAALFLAGLPEEDARFAGVFQHLQPGAGHRPTLALLAGMSRSPEERAAVRTSVADLLRHGLLEPISATGARSEWALQPSPAAWHVLRGDPMRDVISWAVHRPLDRAVPIADLVLAEGLRSRVQGLPQLLESGAVRSVVVRGPRGSGRGTLAAAAARSIGLGTVSADAAELDAARARQLGVLAAAVHAMPVVRLEPGPGEVVELPSLGDYAGPCAFVIPPHGSVSGPALDASISIRLDMPGRAERLAHWTAALGYGDVDDVQALVDRFRMTGGSIRRAAPIALAAARLEGREAVSPDDVLVAARALRSASLETLAARVPVAGTWSDLVVHPTVADELRHVEARCRARERLAGVLPPVMALRTTGVRVLFSGPSGTGKTLAAKVLAAVLGLDLYVVELSSVVDKYLGETEKNLTALFTRAAELDAVLLIDEGDALLTGRTDVRSSNDRYANLQTNHLLQLLEAHEGIVVVTTNAGDRIDQAFQRRMDSTVEFRMPEAEERWRLWERHLGADHDVAGPALAEIADRCAITGAQVRNAVLHAWLLAHGDDQESPRIGTSHVEEAVRREYRKAGATCPLPAALPVAS